MTFSRRGPLFGRLVPRFHRRHRLAFQGDLSGRKQARRAFGGVLSGSRSRFCSLSLQRSMSIPTNSFMPGDSDLFHWWNRARYRLYAPVYDWLAWPMERGRKRVIESLAFTGDDCILLLGCGTGLDLKYLPPKVEVTALDAVPAMIRRTNARAKKLGVEVDTRVGDARALPFNDERFDIVLLHLFLSVVSDPEAVIAETARVLAPAGRVSIYDKFVPEGESPSLLRRALNPTARLLVSDLTCRVEPMVSDTGLEIVDRWDVALGGVYSASFARRTSADQRGKASAFLEEEESGK